MISPTTFHHQLINSVVNHLTINNDHDDAMAFLIRSELLRRTRECMEDQPQMGTSKGEKALAVTALIFFNGDVKACAEQIEKATNEDPDFFYDIELGNHGRTTILAIDL